MMRRCAQMPSPFFIRSTAERLCLSDTYGPLGNPPGVRAAPQKVRRKPFSNLQTKALDAPLACARMAPARALLGRGSLRSVRHTSILHGAGLRSLIEGLFLVW